MTFMAADDIPFDAENNGLPPLSPLELWRIAKMPEAERLSSASEDTLRREHPDKIVKVSKRRDGMRVGHALMIGAGRPRQG
jgi:hypothetical protein